MMLFVGFSFNYLKQLITQNYESLVMNPLDTTKYRMYLLKCILVQFPSRFMYCMATPKVVACSIGIIDYKRLNNTQDYHEGYSVSASYKTLVVLLITYSQARQIDDKEKKNLHKKEISLYCLETSLFPVKDTLRKLSQIKYFKNNIALFPTISCYCLVAS